MKLNHSMNPFVCTVCMPEVNMKNVTVKLQTQWNHLRRWKTLAVCQICHLSMTKCLTHNILLFIAILLVTVYFNN